MRVLLIDSHGTTYKALNKLWGKGVVDLAQDANSAIKLCSDNNYDLVISELSLAGHSGLEFFYEFRTYNDWQSIPVIVYTLVKLNSDVLSSPAWKALNISKYLYKPDSTLKQLNEAVEDVLYPTI